MHTLYLTPSPLFPFTTLTYVDSALWIQVIFWTLWEWLQGTRLRRTGTWKRLQRKRLWGTWQWLQRKRLRGKRATQDGRWRDFTWHLLQLLQAVWWHPKLPTDHWWDKLQWEHFLQQRGLKSDWIDYFRTKHRDISGWVFQSALALKWIYKDGISR